MQVTTLLLHFINATGKKFTLGLENPDDSITPLEVKDVMETIIEKNIIPTTGGDLVAVHSAQVVTRQTTTLMES